MNLDLVEKVNSIAILNGHFPIIRDKVEAKHPASVCSNCYEAIYIARSPVKGVGLGPMGDLITAVAINQCGSYHDIITPAPREWTEEEINALGYKIVDTWYNSPCIFVEVINND